VSVYYVAKNSPEPALKKMAQDIHHVNMPVGPSGKAA